MKFGKLMIVALLGVAASNLAGCDTKGKWEYNSAKSPMDGNTIYGACTDSVRVNNNPPAGKICITYNDSTKLGNPSNFMIDTAGVFSCTAADGKCDVRIKFDDSAPIDRKGHTGPDGSLNVIFVEGDTKELINKLKSSKVVLIDAPVFESGGTLDTYRTAGLVWDH